MTRRTEVVVVGQGYVGLPLAVTAAEHGYSVTGVESAGERLRSLQSGRSYIEDLTSSRLSAVLADGSYRAVGAQHLPAFDIAVITVPTPLGAEGRPDLSAVRSATASVATALRPGALVVLESTSYPGTTEDVVVPLLEQRSRLRAGRDFGVAFSPERVDPGNRAWNLRNTPKIVAGIDERSTRRASEFYQPFVEQLVPLSGTREAELAKLIENTFRYVNIALVNEISEVFGSAGIDVGESLRGAATKPFGYLPFSPGPGVGGHCLPVDVEYLNWFAEQVIGRDLQVVRSAVELNCGRPARAAERIEHALPPDRGVGGARIVLLGMAYKPDIGDLRHAPALEIAALLRAHGAHVFAVDPHVDVAAPELAAVTMLNLHDADVSSADAVVLVVAHSCFDVESISSTARLFVDVHGGVTDPINTSGSERFDEASAS